MNRFNKYLLGKKKEELEYYCWVANVSMNQARQLLELCGNMHKLMAMEARRKKYFIFYCPSTVYQYKQIMALKL